MRRGPAPSLVPTPAEREILGGLAEGKGAKQIAFETGRATNTVHSLSKYIKRRLGARTLTHAVAAAIRRGFI